MIFCTCAADPNHNVFSFMLVYRALPDKYKTLNFRPLQARKNTLEAFTKGISYFCCGALTLIHPYNVRKAYSKPTSLPQARKFWDIVLLYKVFYSTFRSFLARRRRKFFGLPPHISRPWGENFHFPPIFRDPGGEI